MTATYWLMLSANVPVVAWVHGTEAFCNAPRGCVVEQGGVVVLDLDHPFDQAVALTGSGTVTIRAK